MDVSMNRRSRHGVVAALAVLGCTITILALSCGGNGGESLRVANVCPREHDITDGRVIATGILTGTSDGQLLGAPGVDGLSGAIDRILDIIRAGHPKLAEIHAREYPFVFGQVVVGLEPEMEETIHGIVPRRDVESTVRLVTGNRAFDTLNVRLGLQGVESTRDYALLCFSNRLNVPQAVEAYSQVQGISYAHPNHTAGDGPDVEAVRRNDKWYVLFRDAWGDCPAGCMYEELSFFTVEEDRISEVEASQAASDPTFAELISLVGGRTLEIE
jgi:hypothetical protein